MSIKSRIRRLEDREGCQECRDTPRRGVAYYPDKGEEEPSIEHCPKCDRALGFILRVVYEDVRGEGDTT
jgi:hypothetical protein